MARPAAHLGDVAPDGRHALEVLQKLGGWKDLRMVLRYAHLAESYIDSTPKTRSPTPQHATVRRL
jgi:hypothetical protein